MSHGFLPISKEDMKEAGIEQLDFVYICGDAYVDHPSFGHAIISRPLARPSSAVFWKPAATKWASLPSRTGKTENPLTG